MLLTLLSPQGTAALVGSVNATLSLATLNSTATIEGLVGQTAITLGSLTLSTAGQVSSSGTTSRTLDLLLSSSIGNVSSAGTVSKTLGLVLATGTGQVSSSASVSKTLDLLLSSSTGIIVSAGNSGSLSVTLGGLSRSIQGGIFGAGISGITLGAIQGVSVGSIVGTGQVSVSLGSVLGGSAGRFKIGIDTAFLNLIKDDPTIQSLLTNKLFPILNPDNQSFPCVTITRKNTKKDHSLSVRNRFTTVEFDVDTYASRSDSSGGMLKARQIGRAILDRTNNFSGDYQDVKFFSIKSITENEYYDSDLEVFQLSQRFRVQALDPFYSEMTYRWTDAYSGSYPPGVTSVDLDTAFRLILSGNTRISGLVGSRIYPVTTPDNPIFPLIIITKKRASRNYTMTEEQRYVENVYDIDIFAERMGAIPGVFLARRIANEVRLGIDEYAGSFLDVNFQGIVHSDESESYDSEVEIVRITQEYRAFGWE
jgi:hypothetical protein